jgi:hypothetical protein
MTGVPPPIGTCMTVPLVDVTQYTFAVSTASPAHPDCPLASVTRQRPNVHVPLHTVPHAPQFALSDCSSTQRSPHTLCPEGHAHAPDTQLCPVVVHAVPQPPQWAASVCSSTHVVPQTLWSEGHAQAPAVQIWPVTMHAAPQPPQLAASVCSSTHAEPQTLWPEGHAQVAAWHV